MKLLTAVKLLIIVSNRKYKVKSYYLGYREYTENINPRV